ncbi:MAG TPA: MarR family transcriptional regulator [Clostridia bacterium]|nr:MarR family transcriptional regulator [Clostridia bacterium]
MTDLEEKAFIFGTIFVLSNKLQLLGDQMDRRLSAKQWLLLAGILKSGSAAPTVGELAALIGSSRQNVKKMALILEKAGFVTLQKDPGDARMLRISPTQTCAAHLRTREEKELRFLESLFAGFDPDELPAFSRALAKLKQNVQEMEKQHDREEEED